MIFQSLRCSVHALNTLKSDVLGYQQQSTTYVEARGRQAVQNFRYALSFHISIPVLHIDELELNVATVCQVYRCSVISVPLEEQRKEIQHMVISFSETEPLASAFQFQRCTKNGQIYCLGSLIGIKLDV